METKQLSKCGCSVCKKYVAHRNCDVCSKALCYECVKIDWTSCRNPNYDYDYGSAQPQEYLAIVQIGRCAKCKKSDAELNVIFTEAEDSSEEDSSEEESEKGESNSPGSGGPQAGCSIL